MARTAVWRVLSMTLGLGLGVAGAAAGQGASVEVMADVWIPLPGEAVGNAIRELRDGGVVIAGYVRTEESGVDGVVLVLEPDGSVRWLRRYGGDGDQFLWDVRESASGELAVAGFVGPGGEEDVWMMHLDAAGELLWERSWGEAWRDRAWSLDHDGQGGWYVAAERQVESGDQDAWILRVDARGDTVWTRTVGGPEVQRVYSVGALPAGGAVVTGGTGSNDRDQGDNDILVARVGPGGELLWRRDLGGDRYDVGHGVAPVGMESPASALITAYGTSTGDARGDTDAMLIRVDGNGEVEWKRTFQAPGEDRAMMTARVPDGWTVVGYRIADRRVHLLLYGANPDGLRRWRWSWDAPGTGRGVMATALRDGRLAVVGALGGPDSELDGLRVLWLERSRLRSPS